MAFVDMFLYIQFWDRFPYPLCASDYPIFFAWRVTVSTTFNHQILQERREILTWRCHDGGSSGLSPIQPLKIPSILVPFADPHKNIQELQQSPTLKKMDFVVQPAISGSVAKKHWGLEFQECQDAHISWSPNRETRRLLGSQATNGSDPTTFQG